MLTPEKYAVWVNNENNGLIVTKTASEFEFTLRYMPLEYKILMDNAGKDFHTMNIDSMKKDLTGYHYFLLQIATTDHKTDVLKKNIRITNDYYYRIEYFSADIQNDLKLQEGNELYQCVLCQYVRDYNLSPYQQFVLAFPAKKNENKPCDMTLLYTDHVLGINNPVSLTVKGQNLKKIPNLKIK